MRIFQGIILWFIGSVFFVGICIGAYSFGYMVGVTKVLTKADKIEQLFPKAYKAVGDLVPKDLVYRGIQ